MLVFTSWEISIKNTICSPNLYIIYSRCGKYGYITKRFLHSVHTYSFISKKSNEFRVLYFFIIFHLIDYKLSIFSTRLPSHCYEKITPRNSKFLWCYALVLCSSFFSYKLHFHIVIRSSSWRGMWKLFKGNV